MQRAAKGGDARVLPKSSLPFLFDAGQLRSQRIWQVLSSRQQSGNPGTLMRQDQASRLPSLGFSYIARCGADGQRIATWLHPAASWTATFAPPASDDHAARTVLAQRLGEQIAQTITTDAFSDIITILVPLPAGGFVVAVVDQIVTDQVARQLADALTAAVARAFG